MIATSQSSSNRASTILPSQSLPPLSRIDLSLANGSSSAIPAPVKRIQSDEDVLIWKSSKAQENIVLFVSRLCESAVGKGTRLLSREETHNSSQIDDPIRKVWLVLDELQKWTEEIEPLKTPQRFGNLAFRKWGERMENRVSELHQTLLPSSLQTFISELEVYLSGGFGSWQRLDYGSGHELSFLAWLCFLYRLGFFDSSSSVKQEELQAPQISEERIALELFPKYLEVVWTIQDRYGLEPAGSHGVWGLDDYQFIPYAIGSSQLRNQTAYPPIAVVSQSHKPEMKPVKADYILKFMPTSSPIPNSTSRIETIPGPPFANLYTSSIARIHSLKRGPFNEHSPILHDVASTVANWVKVQGGMMKMWQAECLNKRPVVQHFPFGEFGFVWPTGGGSSNQDKDVLHDVNDIPRGPTITNPSFMPPPTKAPWITHDTTSKSTTTRLPMGPTGAPWANSNNALSAATIPLNRMPNPSSNVRSSLASTGSAAATTSPFGILSKAGGTGGTRNEK